MSQTFSYVYLAHSVILEFKIAAELMAFVALVGVGKVVMISVALPQLQRLQL